MRVEGYVRRACRDYGLIESGDRVAVGVSGGKDSEAMLDALNRFRRYSTVSFSLHAVIIDPCFGGVFTDYSLLTDWMERQQIPYTLKRSNIGTVIFEDRKESNPCSLCARMRRGMLHDAALEADCRKIALGHHMNDAVETLFLNLFHEGRLESFRPRTYLSRKDVTVIRPLVLCGEEMIRGYVESAGLPVIKSRCPADGNTERERVKAFIAEKEREYPGFLKKTFGAMRRGNISGYRPLTDEA